MSLSLSGEYPFNNYRSSKYYLILFFIWPFLAFIVSVSNFSKKEARFIVYMFLIYYGFNFVNTNTAIDAYRYALELKINSGRSFSDFFRIVGGLYSDTNVDIVEPLISFIVSRFTSHYSLYFAVWAAIFGFFYLKSINLIYKNIIINPGWNSIILLLFFTMILPITTISGVRMWTAAWMFFYGAYRLITEKNPKFLLITLPAILVHWSFLSANAILVIYFFVGNRNIVYFPLALASFVLPHLASPFFKSIALKLGGGLEQRYSNYSSEGYVSGVQEWAAQSSWFIRITNDLVFYYLLLAIVVIQLSNRHLMNGKIERNLFSFLLLFLAFVNFGMPIPSFGERFMILFFLFATAYLILYFVKLPGTKLSFLVILGLFPMALYTLIIFRIGTESISAWILSPSFGVPLFAPILSLYEVLFM